MSQSLKELIVLTASYYGKTLSAPLLEMYVDDLSDLPTDQVALAYRAYRRNPKNTQFPLPAQIRGVVAPELDPDSIAREVAARITAAIPKYGYANSIDARAYIGEIGWSIVERQGGWPYICERHGVSIDPTAFQAQTRELAKSDLKFSPEAMAHAIGIQGAQRSGELAPASEVIQIPDRRDT